MALVRDAVIVYMKAQSRPICATCVSRGLGLPFDRTLDAWADIRVRGDVVVEAGICGRCGAKADVLNPKS
jgi:hypothetical protein